MNRYGVQAMRHWREWLPEQYAAVADPERSFTALGLWMSDEVARVECELLPSEYYNETDFMTRVGHRGMARLRAEEIVLRHAMPAPEPTDVDDELCRRSGTRSSRPASSMPKTSFCRGVYRIDRGEHGR